MKISDLVAIVTGGASGLGRATARRLHGLGARVAVFDMNQPQGAALVEELGDERCLFRAVDVTGDATVEAAVDEVVDNLGAVHVSVNCAGILNPAKILDRDGNPKPLAGFKAVIDVNLVGTFNVMRVCAAAMARNDPDEAGERGVIVNVASIAAFDAQFGQCAYAASKGGIVALSLPAARELGPLGIRVNSIAPGLFDTEMAASVDEKAREALLAMIEAPPRLGDPDEFAHAVQFLIENRYMNGSCFRLDAATRLRGR
ncbi:MAG: SDR family NAD(P)-dependent oxidoreductase [Gammaproteobacteria bacterium]|nr:SDR family NAD(P)-dependent oxidoreductase [Gammaproteobacteria bacterium]